MLAFLINNWFGLAILVFGIVFFAGYKGRGLVDFLRGLKPIKDGWEKLTEQVKTIAEDIDGLKSNVASLLGAKLASSHSPTKLNEGGQHIAELIRAKSIASKYVAILISEITEGESAYSIQQKCFEFALEKPPKLLSAEDAKIIDDTAFNEGVEKSVIFHTVLGISLRDEILKEKNISLEKIDETQPKARKT